MSTPPRASLYIAIDCGGTKTACVLASSSGVLLSRGAGGASNFTDVGPDYFLRSVTQAVQDALETAAAAVGAGSDGTDADGHAANGADTEDETKALLSRLLVLRQPASSFPLPPPFPIFAAAQVGVSGADRPEDMIAIGKYLSPLLGIPIGPRLQVTNDTALLSAPVRTHPDISEGVLIVCGTGSCLVSVREVPVVASAEDRAEGKDGASMPPEMVELARRGGWGWLLGDEGSALWLGREAVRKVLLDADRALVLDDDHRAAGAPSKLTEAILAHFEINSAYDLFSIVYAADPSDSVPVANPSSKPSGPTKHLALERKHRMALLCPLVFRLAFSDPPDAAAYEVVRGSADLLAGQIADLSLPPTAVAVAAASSASPSLSKRLVNPCKAALCFGGSLVGVPEYRALVVRCLRERGIEFALEEHIADPAGSSAVALAKTFEDGF